MPGELARRHGVCVDEATSDARRAYAGFAAPVPTSYGGWLPTDDPA